MRVSRLSFGAGRNVLPEQQVEIHFVSIVSGKPVCAQGWTHLAAKATFDPDKVTCPECRHYLRLPPSPKQSKGKR